MTTTSGNLVLGLISTYILFQEKSFARLPLQHSFILYAYYFLQQQLTILVIVFCEQGRMFGSPNVHDTSEFPVAYVCTSSIDEKSQSGYFIQRNNEIYGVKLQKCCNHHQFYSDSMLLKVIMSINTISHQCLNLRDLPLQSLGQKESGQYLELLLFGFSKKN